jgi:hypothetical protein
MARAPKTKKIETQAAEVASEPSVNLSVADLAAVVQIIDFAASRGAFTGDNITKVGQVRDRIAEVVKVLTPPETSEAAPAEAN